MGFALLSYACSLSAAVLAFLLFLLLVSARVEPIDIAFKTFLLVMALALSGVHNALVGILLLSASLLVGALHNLRLPVYPHHRLETGLVVIDCYPVILLRFHVGVVAVPSYILDAAVGLLFREMGKDYLCVGMFFQEILYERVRFCKILGRNVHASGYRYHKKESRYQHEGGFHNCYYCSSAYKLFQRNMYFLSHSSSSLSLISS